MGRNSCQAFVCCDGVIAVHHLHAIKEFLHFSLFSLSRGAPIIISLGVEFKSRKASLLYSCCCFSSGLLERFLTLLSVASSLTVWVSTPSSLVCYTPELKNTLVGLLFHSLFSGGKERGIWVLPHFLVSRPLSLSLSLSLSRMVFSCMKRNCWVSQEKLVWELNKRRAEGRVETLCATLWQRVEKEEV